MNYYYSYPPVTFTTCSGMRGPTVNGVAQPVTVAPTVPLDPPYPAGYPITPATPIGPGISNPQVNGTQLVSAAQIQRDAEVDNYIARKSGRGSTAGFVDNILNQNKGKLAKVHMTFNSGEGQANTKVFTGIIEACARDHLILSDPQTGARFVLLMVYLDYVEFGEEINYFYPGRNQLNVADPAFLERYPDIMPLYEYQNAQSENFLHHLQSLVYQEEIDAAKKQ